jgi:DNA-binding transcriptional ArsR family regulator
VVNETFAVLSHPIRREIVERLTSGPATIGEATRGIAVSKPAITKHVRALEQAGVVSRRIEGRTHRLELKPAGLGEAADWLDAQRERWEHAFDAVEAYLAESAR